MTRLIAMVVFLFVASIALPAQTIQSYNLQVYQPGVDPATGTPFQVTSIPASAVQCNQPPAAVGVLVANPTTVTWDDPANAGKSCVVNQSAFFLTLPIVAGNYAATVTAVDDAALESARSAPSNPFTRRNPPAVRTNVRLVR